jgi:hypothetical protein
MVHFLHWLGFPGTEGELLFELVAISVFYGISLYWARATFLAREGIRHTAAAWINDYIAPLYLFGCGCLFLSHPLTSSPESHIIFALGAVFMFGAFYAALKPRRKKRKRTIPKHIRDAVIARDLKGKPFDPAIHHIDHVWPYILGGSHTIDNLRVYDRKKNLQKGSKRPRMRDMWFQTRERL